MTELPIDTLKQFLGSWYDQEVQSALRAPKAPDAFLEEGGSVFDVQLELSSINAVPVLLRLKDILGFEPSKKIIKRGGYRSKLEFVTSMLDGIEKATAANLTAVGVPSAGVSAHDHI